MERTGREKQLVRITLRITLAIETAKRSVIEMSMAQWRWLSNRTTLDLMQRTGPLFEEFTRLQRATTGACATLDRLERERAALEGKPTP